MEANNQLKAQYAYKIQDPYYAAMACSALQSSPEEETFTRFWGCLVTMFGGHARHSKFSVTSKGIDTEVNQISDLESKLSKNSRQHQNKTNRQEAQINSLQNQNTQLKGLLDTKLLVNAIRQTVNTSLKMNSQPTNKGDAGANGIWYTSKPYLGKPQPSQLAPGPDGSLNPNLKCQYCKDTSHLKENCIKLHCRLAQEQKQTGSNSTAPTTHASKLAN